MFVVLHHRQYTKPQMTHPCLLGVQTIFVRDYVAFDVSSGNIRKMRLLTRHLRGASDDA